MHDLQSEQFLEEVNQISLIPGYACVVCEQVEQEKRKAALKLNKSLKRNALCALFKSLKDSGKCFTIISVVLSLACQTSGISYRKEAEFNMEKIFQLPVVNIPPELQVTVFICVFGGQMQQDTIFSC